MPVPGTTKASPGGNLGAATLELDSTDLAAIEAALRQIESVGEHHPAHLQQRVGR
ncbi:hypothetical protein [Pseudomonas nitroreducens]|uniref:Aldo/keto reductase n=1 Tax=Pseudomonas nitroreducens TaxID=46680 RepID=A0ABS0KQB9_PSENT|nr:hypothetical protein [Pseudomonas nitroreducens]MBG6290154.1 hypothetical protein [Pseudomonas nitroreducens]NMZ59061.1 hypothetical protein [Pseudomonas nitroreducens]